MSGLVRLVTICPSLFIMRKTATAVGGNAPILSHLTYDVIADGIETPWRGKGEGKEIIGKLGRGEE